MSVIVIAGGSRGIGASAAEHIAQQRMGVILAYNSDLEMEFSVVACIEHAGGKAVALKFDVAEVAGFSAFRESVALALRETWDATAARG